MRTWLNSGWGAATIFAAIIAISVMIRLSGSYWSGEEDAVATPTIAPTIDDVKSAQVSACMQKAITDWVAANRRPKDQIPDSEVDKLIKTCADRYGVAGLY